MDKDRIHVPTYIYTALCNNYGAWPTSTSFAMCSLRSKVVQCIPELYKPKQYIKRVQEKCCVFSLFSSVS